MAEAAEFAIGAKASASDGVCGEVSRLVMDPVALTVTHLVIEPKHRRRARPTCSRTPCGYDDRPDQAAL